MNLPLYMKDAFSYPVAMALGTLLGFGFGFVLERSGFGRSRILAAQFYGRDMRVLKVMFSAIVTATVGLGILGGVGVVDMAAISVPETFLWPQIVGGLILGAGFVMSGYCPGTAVVATASGHIDGIVSLFGVMLGSVVFALGYPSLETFYLSSSMGRLTLPDLLGVPWVVVALGVAAMAVGAFAFAEWVEKALAKRAHTEPPASPTSLRRGVYAGFAGAAVVCALTLMVPTGEEQAVAGSTPKVGAIGALELAEATVHGDARFYVVDVRSAEACAKSRVPGALCLPADDPQANLLSTFPATRPLVVYDADGTASLPAGVAKFAGTVFRLSGGWSAFEQEILTEPKPPEPATPATIAQFRLRQALYGRFTGQASAPAPAVVAPKAVSRAVKKGGGC